MTDESVPAWLRGVPIYVWPSRDARSPLPPESIMVRLADVIAAADATENDPEIRQMEARWSAEEHLRACEAIRQSEGLDPNTYPSFRERVWWRAFADEVARLRADVCLCCSQMQPCQDGCGCRRDA